MKKLLMLICVMSLFNASAQLWFDLGLKGGVGSGFILNKTLNNDGRLALNPGFNYFYGGKVGVNFGENFGITCDVDYGSYSYSFGQVEVPGKTQNATYKYRIGFNALNVAPLFRYTKESSYLELGPQFSFVKNGSIEDEAYPSSAPAGDIAISNRLNGVIFGFGGHMVGNEIISLMMGLRFNYVFSDLTGDAYADTNFPFTNYSDITERGKLTPLNVQFVMEINYSLGYFVRASCGRRTAFLTF